MNYKTLERVKQVAYAPNQIAISDFKKNEESQEYEACTFSLLNKRIIFRKAKITPTKIGHFVTIWKRENGVTAPFDNNDAFDYLIISVEDSIHFGQFIFNKKALLQQGVIASRMTKGKRGIRIYSPWIAPNNKLALKAKEWQCKSFINLNGKSEVIFSNLKRLLL